MTRVLRELVGELRSMRVALERIASCLDRESPRNAKPPGRRPPLPPAPRPSDHQPTELDRAYVRRRARELGLEVPED